MSGFKIDEDAVRALSSLLEESGLGEIEYTDGERTIRVAKAGVGAAVAVAPAPQAVAVAPVAASDGKPEAVSAGAVTAPMVGTVYLQSGPGEPNFVTVGDRVRAGDVLMIIEAMKVMNQITAAQSGVVAAIHVDNAQAVEFGEVLMVVE